MEESWQNLMRKRVRSVQGDTKSGSSDQPWETRALGLPFAATTYWLELAEEDYKSCKKNEFGVPIDPILAQALPSPMEQVLSPLEMKDPLHEHEHGKFPRIIHQYPSRILLRTTGECPMFCRYCFRRSLLPEDRGFMNDEEQENARLYLSEHAEVREVLVSGGDPLTASNEKLEALFSRLRAGRSDVLLRLCTRAPITIPERIDDGLLELLVRFRPLHIVIHTNHPRELSLLFREKIDLVLKAGIPVRSQTVLLRGINDTTSTLVELFSTLTRIGIDPYYLFQGDLAMGTSHFRVPLSRGLKIYDELRQLLSGLEIPRFAVDAPDGSGKLYLPESVVRLEGDKWILRAPDGSLHSYPEEPELLTK